MNKNIIETIMGAVVLLIAGGFLYNVYQSKTLSEVSDGYAIEAVFDNVSGISVGSDIRIAGVKIGVVSDLIIDAATYRAKVMLNIDSKIKIPEDSSAAIIGDGLLGSKFVAIEAGGDEKMLTNRGIIKFTQSSVSLEQLLGKFIFSAGGVDNKKDADTELSLP